MSRLSLGRIVRSLARTPAGRSFAGRSLTGRSLAGRSSAAASSAYQPDLDGAPDPGEIVWAWVAYEDDPTRGKDRPVLLIGREGATFLGLQLSSQDHDRDAADEARFGRYWMDIGAGDWDSQHRPSEVRVDRLLRLDESAVRREGAVLDRARFEAVLLQARAHHAL